MRGYYEHHRDSMAQAHAWYAKDDHFTPHFHSSIELVYVLEGELLATLDGELCRVGAGEMLVNSSYTIHSYETPASSYSIIAIIPLAVTPALLQTLSKKSFGRCVCPDDADGTLRQLMTQMVRFCQIHPQAVRGLCDAVLSVLADRLGLVDARPSSRTAFIRDVLEYLQQRHAEPLTVQQLADRFGYSRSRFSHIFHEHLGYTLTNHLSALRCRHAARLLRETELPVSDVAMAAGFESLRTFYRAFKKQYEMTPNQFRGETFGPPP